MFEDLSSSFLLERDIICLCFIKFIYLFFVPFLSFFVSFSCVHRQTGNLVMFVHTLKIVLPVVVCWIERQSFVLVNRKHCWAKNAQTLKLKPTHMWILVHVFPDMVSKHRNALSFAPLSLSLSLSLSLISKKHHLLNH